ncbi:MAG: hypothetical protein V9H69_19810 [Anaerolineae bacterium]
MAVALKPLVDFRLPAAPVLTLADFDALPEGPPDFELDGGRLIAMPRPHPRHQKVDHAFEVAADWTSTSSAHVLIGSVLARN